MAYSDYGLDDVKKSMDEGAAGKSSCLWCQMQVDNGFSMCFSNWCICKRCVETSDLETSKTRWITDDCFKCNKKRVECFSSDTDTVISVCRDCIGWAKQVLDNNENYFLKMSQEILKQCTVDGMVVKLPVGQLDRKVYGEIKNALELIGGKWKGNKVQGFVFEEDPTELLAELASGEKRNLKKEYQFFATPPELALKMVGMLPIRNPPIGEMYPSVTILEPSAGDGALIKALHSIYSNIKVDCFELMELNRMKLAKVKGANIIGNDFLEAVRIDELELIRGQYSHIIANPPFTKNQDIEHILAMYECLMPGGKLVTLSSPSWQFGSQKRQTDFRMWLQFLEAKTELIEEGTFKQSGTNVRTILIEIDKPLEEPKGLPYMEGFKKPIASLKKNFEEPSAPENIFIPLNDDLVKQAIESGFIEKHVKKEPDHRPPAEIIKDIISNEKEIDALTRDLQKMISPLNNNDMTFFTELAAVGNVDMSLRIMQKNGKLTINVTPASMSATIQPIILTGTPEELDNGFFSEVFPEVRAIAGIASNLKEVKAEVEKKVAAATAKPTSAEKKEVKPAAKKVETPIAKALAVKQVSSPANDLFGDDDEDVAVAESGNSDDDQNQDDE